MTHARVKRHLGGAFDAVVLDLHGGLDADVVGQVHGLVRGGGSLLLRMPSSPPVGPASLAVRPHRPSDVCTRLWSRLEHLVATHCAVVPAAVCAPTPVEASGTAEQRAVVQRLVRSLTTGTATKTVLTAERGRGKSSALGLAVREVLETDPDHRVVIAAPSAAAAAQVLAFAGHIELRRPEALRAGGPWQTVIIDEAAQLPVPLLQQIVTAHPHAHIAMATTTAGYEGTGRGFVLRFLRWLRQQPGSVVEETLECPQRWSPDDPLEDFVRRLLVHDAAISPAPSRWGAPRPVRLDRDALATDEPLLRSLFGLLVHAHYRTTPADLHRLLDAPNLSVHAMVQDGQVLGATLVAREGSLPRSVCADVAAGAYRLVGHALTETLVHHLGEIDAGSLRLARSVRIATHPDRRRMGIARELVDHVHRSERVDAFGTLFGATRELMEFRRSLGYSLVRVGVSRGGRSGEPTAVMLRPVSPRGHVLVHRVRAALSRDLPTQLARFQAEDPLGLSPDLRDAFLHDLPAPAPFTDHHRRRVVHAYLHHGLSFEASAGALCRTVGGRRGDLSEATADLIEDRLFHRVPWATVAQRHGLGSVPAAMRALRRALAELLLSSDNM